MVRDGNSVLLWHGAAGAVHKWLRISRAGFDAHRDRGPPCSVSRHHLGRCRHVGTVATERVPPYHGCLCLSCRIVPRVDRALWRVGREVRCVQILPTTYHGSSLPASSYSQSHLRPQRPSGSITGSIRIPTGWSPVLVNWSSSQPLSPSTPSGPAARIPVMTPPPGARPPFASVRTSAGDRAESSLSCASWPGQRSPKDMFLADLHTAVESDELVTEVAHLQGF